MESNSTRAVFLSYAREDTTAALRIAEALRSNGIDVWFDQSELRGGDGWDQKIRKQIKECAIFIALISERTELRQEGYFRLEWKLAAERTHLMVAGTPFLLPVVVDGTSESTVMVPDEFLRVQWTRLPGSLPTPQFIDQVRGLLDSQRRPAVQGRGSSAFSTAAVPGIPRNRPGLPGWAWAALVIAAAVTAGAVYLNRKTAPAPAAEAGVAAHAVAAKSIAVLPFDNLSPEKENDFFADGVHEEVITALAKIHDLKVVSRTSVMVYRTGERNLRKIAAELGVANVLEGSVRREGNQVRVTAQLIDARTDEHLWAEAYTRDLTNVFTIQSELAGAITAALKATLSPEEKSLIERRPTENRDAYDLYLRARAMSDTIGYATSRDGIDNVVSLYEQAVTLDPGFVLAYVQLTVENGKLYWFGHLDPTLGRLARAKAALDAAVRLDPNSPETHLALGSFAYFCDNDWTRSLSEFTTAAGSLPNDAQVIYAIGRAQRRLGHLAEALTYYARAMALNSRDITCMQDQVETLNMMRRNPEALELCERYRTYYPNSADLLRRLAKIRFETSRDKRAFIATIGAGATGTNDYESVLNAYYGAMVAGDLVAADRELADSRLTYVPSPIRVLNEPVSLHRGLVAFLRGKPEEARAFGADAVVYLKAAGTTVRQEAVVMADYALALALVGQADQAVNLAREALVLQTSRDLFATATLRPRIGQVFLVLNRREEALAMLHNMMTFPCDMGPEELRNDLLWSRLKDDPRFEQILASAKPL